MNRTSFSVGNWFYYRTISLILLSGLLLTTFCSKTDPDYPDADPFISGAVSSLQTDSIRNTISWLEGMQTRYFLAPNHRDVALKLRDKFTGMGYLNAVMDSFQLVFFHNGTRFDTWQYNVVATLEGSNQGDAFFIAGAHYDCIAEDGDPMVYAPGADDNGSGVAAIMEMARVLKQMQFIPRIPIRFVLFAAEENDLDGSTNYAWRISQQELSVALMLNLDMIGYEPSDDAGQWTVNIMDYPNSGIYPEVAARACSQYTSLQCITDNTYNEEGDSYSFYREGYPALFLISARENEAYHSTNDRLSRCNMPYCREVTALSLALLLDQSR